ncbi:MAG TPA: sulfotransferase [Bacteroidia bacterium]|nr:sulfotransferase [Bacteroidia bacterium]
MKKDLPIFIIVGAMKSGTTTLHQLIVHHPNIAIAANELHFFDREKNFQKGLEWYYSKLSETATADTLIIGEKTPTYSFVEHIPGKIHENLPAAKLIWIFRNPIDRAYSNYWHAVTAGVEPSGFEYAVRNEKKRMQKNIFHGYLNRSLYHEQVERYLEFFPSTQMHYIIFEDLIQNPEAELGRLFDFLDIPADGNSPVQQHANKSSYPAWPWSVATAKKIFGGESRIYKFILQKNISFGKKKRMNQELRKELVKYFREPNEKLADLIGVDTRGWNK